MKRKKLTRKVVLLLAALAVAAAMLLRTDAAGDRVCQVLREEVPKRAGVDLEIGLCRLDPLTGSVKLRDIGVYPKGTRDAWLTADEADVSLRSVFFGEVSLGDVRLVRPRVKVDASAAPAPKSSSGCGFKVLDRVRIDRLTVKNASIDVRLPGKRSVSIDGLDVEWATRRGIIGPQVSFASGLVELGQGRMARLGPALIEGEIDVDEESVSLQRGDLSIEGVSVKVTGGLEQLCDAAPRLSLNAQLYVPVASAMRLVKGPSQAAGNVWSRISLTGRTSAPVVKAEVQGSEVAIGNAYPGDFTARLAWSGAELQLEEFTSATGPSGSVKVSGTVKLEQGLPAKVKVETQEASLGNILMRAGLPGAWVDLPATGKVTLSGGLYPKFSLQGDAEMKVGRFTLATRPYDQPEQKGLTILTFGQGHTELKLGIFTDRVAMTNIRAEVGPQWGTHVSGEVTLYFDPERGLDIRAQGDHLQLDDFGHIAGLPWEGQGEAQVSISGPYRHVGIDAQVALHDFKLSNYALGVVSSPLTYRDGILSFPSVSGQKGKTQYTGRVDLAFRPDELHVTAAVAAPKGRTEDLVDVIAGLSPTLTPFQNGVLAGDVAATAKIDSAAKALTGTIGLALKDTRYYGRQLGDGAASLRFDRGLALVLDELKLKGPLGNSSASGRWEFAGPLDFVAGIERGAMAELLGASVGASGSFTAKATAEGEADRPVVHATLDSPMVQLGGSSVGPAALVFELKNRQLTVLGTPLSGVKGEAHLSVREPYPFEALLNLQLEDLKPFMPAQLARQGLSAAAAGTLKVTGDLRGTDTIGLTADLERLWLGRGDFGAVNDGPVHVSWAEGSFTIGALTLKGPNTELVATGSWGPVSADLSARGQADLRLLESFVPEIDRLAGRIDLTASVTGPVKDPAVVGSAEVKDARFSVKNQAVTVKALSGHLEFSKARVLLQEFQGFMNDGRVNVRGDVRLAGASLQQVEVGVDLEQVTVQPKPDYPATVTGSLLFYGKPSAYQLSGGLDVTRFRYAQRLDLDNLLASLRSSSSLVSEGAQPIEWLRYDVDLEAGNDVKIDNNLARAKLKGKVKLAGTNLRPLFIGLLEAGEGSQAFFRGNVFSIGRASVQLSGLVPTFELNAQSQVREYLVSVKAFGRLDDPKVSLSSQPPLSESDILSLLTLGVTSKEQVAGTAGYGLAAEALLSATGLDSQVQRFLSKGVLKDQQVHLSTTFNAASGKAEPSVSWESKLISDQFKVEVTQPVSGRGTRAQAEYRFNDRVSARAQWNNQTDVSSFGNPGLDFKFRFEWE